MSWRTIQILGLSVLAAVCGWLFYTRYWQWRDCIRDAASSCITPDGQSLTSGGLMWGFLAAVLAAAALRIAFRP
ncbi:MAG: hypothetical protein K2X43_10375 [Hyphomonadaceae bacterium]|jgi:hypothetical protein|nr:hypothetical protein [Hyphomonadaceae bacterium]